MAHLIFEQGKGVKPTLELLFQIKAAGLPSPVAEVAFDDTRKWRFDLCWPEHMTALEIEGGIFRREGGRPCYACGEIPKGRHATGKGMLNDIHKYNSAALLGWKLIRVTPQMVSNGEAISLLERALR